MQALEQVRDDNQLNTALVEMDAVVFKRYLDYLSQFELVSLDTKISDAVKNIRLRKIARIVYDREESNLVKLNTVFSAMHSAESSVCLILDARSSHTDLYIGTNKRNKGAGLNGNEAMETLESSLKGNFPGMDISHNLVDREVYALLSSINYDKHNAIASVVGVPSLKDDSVDNFTQGLEKLIEGMQGKEYFAVIQATPVSYGELEHIESAYENIYTALSTSEQTQLSFTENDSRSVGISLTEGISKTITASVSHTQTQTKGTNYSTTDSQSSLDVKRAIAGAIGGAASGAVMAGAVSAGIGAPAGALAGLIAGGAAGLFGGSHSTSRGDNESISLAKGTSHSDAQSTNSSKTNSDTSTIGTGKTIQITEKNRRVSSLLTLIDEQLKRIKECKSYGMWNWGAYFISDSEVNARLGADLYSGLLRGNVSGLERNGITVWNRFRHEQRFSDVQNYIAQLTLPLFVAPEGFRTTVLSPASLVSTKELSIAMSLPQKSLAGIPVLDSVAFGRSVNRISKQNSKKIRIGAISNYGVVDKTQPVEIDTQSLTSHVFVTGSTGAGKSNTIYALLDKLNSEQKIPFLIIEPAKGEYKQVFGGRDDVSVYGTNPSLTPLLRINPFSFPSGIHIVEHIDRLIEILNAVWPMYAAMPAILKEALERTYEQSGWDLLNSVCSLPEPVYPDFYDLLEVLPKVIQQSDYSDEVKGNYSGALVTRVKSLTNGYFSTIFQKDEISPSILFDQSCIVDLSRVGSSETKSLLMGIIFLKLQEYRIATSSETNSELKHITVLEEAHNLLRRTSSEQSQEGANLQGKSVEMISNAIAEMRTYGEGFIIADQAPGLLDQSVIRNTNTKIILRLPDFDDRNLVGKAAFLSEEQIIELARLETGCAAVYQNNWLEPVLCQFDRFDDERISKFIHEQANAKLPNPRKLKLTNSIKQLLEDVRSLNTDLGENKAIASKRKLAKQKELIEKLKLSVVLDSIPKNNNIDVWLQSLAIELANRLEISILSIQEQKELLGVVLDILSDETPHNRGAFEVKKVELLNATGGPLWH
jgi:DNA helicase HerA-like ATPase